MQRRLVQLRAVSHQTLTSETTFETGLPMPRRLWAVVAITSGSMLYPLDGTIANVALPVIANRLEITPQTAVLLVSTYNLVLAMLLLPLAAVGERMGHRRVFMAGLALYLLASAGCLMSTAFVPLLAFRALQAVAAAGLLSVSMAMVRMVYPPEILGRGLGFNTMCAALGSAIAAPLGGWIIHQLAWQGVFAAGFPLALAGLASARNLPDPDPHEEPYDRKGAMLCALTFGLLVASLQALSQGAPGWTVAVGLCLGVIAAFLFVQHEQGVSMPVLPIDLLARPALALSVGSGLLAVLASTMFLISLPFQLHDMGFDSVAIGAMIAPYAFTVLVVAPASGMLSDKIRAEILGTIGLAIGTVGQLSLLSLPSSPSFFDLAWRLVCCSLGFSLFFSPNGRLVVGSVPRKRAAGAASLLATSRTFGQTLGSVAVAGLLAFRLPHSASALACAVLAVLAFFLSAARIFICPGGQGQ